ncbi:signal-transduction protein with cAMP-binding, CBS, and nucleotidyltransferase domain [Flavobacterium sp. HSC-32F16]|uniref:Crp/Fnr family transcriptional regulator n=1 Tax=Flavobacterium sp. HSC-32F16 TaxID=2910964 RepID=UPI0020A3DC80|nr:Crp/Fnr family transcriptional regulator [Flavobacterium sp. HSC-32F16]MCP2029370.1 signal-transduction protein with cAMP-binding, CBS, and nucleotidyltransferase domain [Flavobacterium sp. HSC-32F16]
MKQLIDAINGFQVLDNDTEDAIKKYFVIEKYKKGDFIIQEGKICRKVYFIKSGTVRRFCIENDLEITKWIYTDNQFITSLSSFFEQKPSFENFQACEDTVLYSLSYSDEQILLEYPLFSMFHIKQLRLYLSKINEFHHLFRVMSAQQKYQFLLDSFPQIILKAKLKYIASLLNVSQETLSRIRASIS